MGGKYFFILRSNVVGLVLLVTVFVLEFRKCYQQQCKSGIRSQYGYAMFGSQYDAFYADDYPACLMACHNDANCTSLNYHLATKTCEFNQQSKESNPKLYKKKMNTIYLTKGVSPKFTAGSVSRKVSIPSAQPSNVTYAKSCREILNSGKSVGTGVYPLDPANTGIPIKAYCDMTTDGGGWTIVTRLKLQSSSVPPQMRFTDHKIIAKYNMNGYINQPLSSAMKDILDLMGFHQIHFYCSKKSVGRVVSIMTKSNSAGQQVVRFFTDDAFADALAFPDACGSFDRLPEDNSMLAQNCERWGKINKNNEVKKWSSTVSIGKARIARPFGIESPNFNAFWMYNAGSTSVCACDDNRKKPSPYTEGDRWEIAVR